MENSTSAVPGVPSRINRYRSIDVAATRHSAVSRVPAFAFPKNVDALTDPFGGVTSLHLRPTKGAAVVRRRFGGNRLPQGRRCQPGGDVKAIEFMPSVVRSEPEVNGCLAQGGRVMR